MLDITSSGLYSDGLALMSENIRPRCDFSCFTLSLSLSCLHFLFSSVTLCTHYIRFSVYMEQLVSTKKFHHQVTSHVINRLLQIPWNPYFTTVLLSHSFLSLTCCRVSIELPNQIKLKIQIHVRNWETKHLFSKWKAVWLMKYLNRMNERHYKPKEYDIQIWQWRRNSLRSNLWMVEDNENWKACERKQ
jgi:hypothetical protein